MIQSNSMDKYKLSFHSMHWTKNKYTSICSLFTIIVTYMSFKQNRNHLKLLWIDLVLLTFIDPSLPLNFVILAILKHFRTYYQETQFVLQVIFNINQFAFFVILIIWFFVDIPYTSRYFPFYHLVCELRLAPSLLRNLH